MFTFQRAREHLSVYGSIEQIILTGSYKEKSREYANLLKLQCERLTALLNDTLFTHGLDSLIKQAESPDAAYEIQAIMLDLKRFLDYIPEEKKVLMEAGLSEPLAEAITYRQYLTRQIHLQQIAMDSAMTVRLPSLQDIPRSLESIRQSVCSTARVMDEHADYIQSRSRADRRELVWLGYATLIANATATTYGPNVATVSLVFAQMFFNQANNLTP